MARARGRRDPANKSGSVYLDLSLFSAFDPASQQPLARLSNLAYSLAGG